MTNVLSLSGGKDSCASGLIMKENNIPIDLIVSVDVGRWEFPQTREAIQQVCSILEAPHISLKPVDFDWWMTERLQVHKDKTYSFGAGWPSRQNGRWCTREKFKEFDKLMSTITDPVKFIGFGADEEHRTQTKEQLRRKKKGEKFRYPLIEYGLTEQDALELCYSYGIDWGGLYEIFRTNRRTPRLSCWCCPLQPLESLRILRKEFPQYWSEMLQMEEGLHLNTFRGLGCKGTTKTVRDMEDRFALEDKQTTLI